MKMFIAVLAVVLAVAVNAGPVVPLDQQRVSAQLADIHQGAADNIIIDVTRDFINFLGEETLLQVNLDVEVVSGMLHINGQPAQLGIAAEMRLSASLTLRNRLTNAVIEQRVSPIAIQVHVQATVSTNGVRTLNLQEAITEIDGTVITEIDVQEAIFEVDVNGQELSRSVTGHIALTQSRLAFLATPSTSTYPVVTEAASSTSAAGSVSGSPTSANSANSASDSDANSSESGDHHHGRICFHKFAHWFQSQKLIVRALLVAIAAFVFCFILNFLFCCLLSACCPKKQASKRDVYLNNVKLHYSPISMEDEDDCKKVTVA